MANYLQDAISLTRAQKNALVSATAARRGAERRAKGQNPSDKLLLSNARREVNSKVGSSFALKTRKADADFIRDLQAVLYEGRERFETPIYQKNLEPQPGESNPSEFTSRDAALEYIGEVVALVGESYDRYDAWNVAGTEPVPALLELYQQPAGTVREVWTYGDKGIPKMVESTETLWLVESLVYYQPSE